MNHRNKYFMPAEWEDHERTLIEWPVKDSLVWPENHEEVCLGYSSVLKAISDFEHVTLIVNEGTLEEARKYCGNYPEYLVIPHNDAWSRDNCPTFVFDNNGKRKGINWKFNAWGEKYLPYDLDDMVSPRILELLNIPCVDVPVVLEGGSVHSDGEGTILTTEECLLNPNRNPELSKEDIEKTVAEYLGAEQIIWLKKGLFGDETDGHIDNIACFAKPGVILMQTCHDPEDPNYEITRENLDILSKARDARGRELKIIEIPQPPVRMYNGKRLTLSYLNFYFVNKGIILPVFGEDAQEADDEAEKILQQLFPERKIVRIDGMTLIKEGGNVHCITQQVPAEKNI